MHPLQPLFVSTLLFMSAAMASHGALPPPPPPLVDNVTAFSSYSGRFKEASSQKQVGTFLLSQKS